MLVCQVQGGECKWICEGLVKIVDDCDLLPLPKKKNPELKKIRGGTKLLR